MFKYHSCFFFFSSSRCLYAIVDAGRQRDDFYQFLSSLTRGAFLRCKVGQFSECTFVQLPFCSVILSYFTLFTVVLLA